MRGFVQLDVGTFVGMCAGAQHYYGKLRSDGHEDVELEHRMGSSLARQLNREDQFGCSMYRADDTTKRFAREEDVIAEAVRRWRTDFPEGWILVRDGDHYNPGEVIDCEVDVDSHLLGPFYDLDCLLQPEKDLSTGGPAWLPGELWKTVLKRHEAHKFPPETADRTLS